MQRSIVIARHNLRLILTDPGPLVQFVVTPLILMTVLRSAQKVLLHSEGFPSANGSEQVVPAFTFMFSFFWMGYVGRMFFAEHGWGTWERLQTTAATRAEIMVGKLVPFFLLMVVQQTFVFTVGALLFGLPARGGRILELFLVDVPLVTCVLTLALALISLLGTLAQLEAIAQGVQMGLATLCGALVPLAVLPHVVRSIAPALPLYWPLRAARRLILEGKGVEEALVAGAVLLGFAALFAAVAASRFSFGQAKSVRI
jgi:ABC-2 type transport system permease protein